jgi:hypothetical protein
VRWLTRAVWAVTILLLVIASVTLVRVYGGNSNPNQPAAGGGGGGGTSVPSCAVRSPSPHGLAPACGALWGFYSQRNNVSATAAVEATVGRKFDVVKHYHDFSGAKNGTFPTPEEVREADQGHILDEAWSSTLFSSGDPGLPPPDAVTGSGQSIYTWSTVASGALDGYIDSVAARVRDFGRPLILDFGHEADIADPTFGSPADYVAAYRHVVQRFRQSGATNVTWAWVVSGSAVGPVYRTRYQALYPGDDVVDWIGWDPYNHTIGNWRPPLELFRRFYDELDSGLLGPAAAEKPRLLGEYGCMADPRRTEWLRQVPAALEQLPRLKLAIYFNSGSWAALDAAGVKALGDAGRDPYVSS